MFRNWLLALALLVSVAPAAFAYRPPPPPLPPPPPAPGSVDGLWYFRGDRSKPCAIRIVPGPNGPSLMFVNEKGTPAVGYFSRGGREVVIPAWNLTGRFRDNMLVWPNGDFWGR